MNKDKIDELIERLLILGHAYIDNYIDNKDLQLRKKAGLVNGAALALQSQQKQNDIDADFIKQYQRQVEQLTQERDEWMQQAEHRRVIIRDRKAQVELLTQERDAAQQAGVMSLELGAEYKAQAQKLKDKLARCSAMFDEVEDALADSCRREGKYKEALEKIADPIMALGGFYGSCAVDRKVIQKIAQEALQAEGKEETIIDIRAGVQIGAPTGGDKGTGTIRYPKAHCKEDKPDEN